MHKFDYSKLMFAASCLVVIFLTTAPRMVQAQSSVAGWAEKEDQFEVSKGTKVTLTNRSGIFQSGTFASPEEEQRFVDYYNKNVFPHITERDNRLSPKENVVIALRKDLYQASKAEAPNVYNKLAELTLSYMTKVAADENVHPVARVNAILAIGEVNTSEAAQTLVENARRGPFPGIRVAAMTGLVRMSGPSGKGLLAGPNLQPSVVGTMVTWANYHPKKSEGVDGYYWIRGQAAEILGELQSTGGTGQVPPALLNMLSDTDMPIPLRSKAALALGKLDYAGGPPDADPYLKAFAQLADDAVGSEQATNRARVRVIIQEILAGVKPFSAPKIAGEQELASALQKCLLDLTKDTEEKMSTEELKTATDKAKAVLDALVAKK